MFRLRFRQASGWDYTTAWATNDPQGPLICPELLSGIWGLHCIQPLLLSLSLWHFQAHTHTLVIDLSDETLFGILATLLWSSCSPKNIESVIWNDIVSFFLKKWPSFRLIKSERTLHLCKAKLLEGGWSSLDAVLWLLPPLISISNLPTGEVSVWTATSFSMEWISCHL